MSFLNYLHISSVLMTVAILPVSVCYFLSGCKLLLYPGCFNMTTGPAHWELLQRGRAVDNQVSPADLGSRPIAR